MPWLCLLFDGGIRGIFLTGCYCNKLAIFVNINNLNNEFVNEGQICIPDFFGFFRPDLII